MKDPSSFEEFWPIYLKAHNEPATRALHVGGAVVGLGCAAVFVATGHPGWALAGLVAAYGAAWIGHVLDRAQRAGHVFSPALVHSG